MNTYFIYKFKLLPLNKYVSKHINKWDCLFNASNSKCPFYHPLFLTSNANQNLDSLTVVYYENGQEHNFGFLAKILNKGETKICQIDGPENLAADHLIFLDNSDNVTLTKYFLLNFNQITKCHLIQGDYVSTELTHALSKKQFLKLFIGFKIKCPRLILNKLNPDIISSFSSKKFRANLRQSEKKAIEAGLQFRHSTDSSNFSHLFSMLIKLHLARITFANKSSLFLNKPVLNYHKAIISESKKYSKVVRFYYYEMQKEIIGMIYGFAINDTFYFFQSGINPKFENYSIGNLILLNAIKKLKSEKIEIFDFMRGADKYKFKWTKEFVENYTFVGASNFKGLYPLFREKLRYYSRKNGRVKGLIQTFIK